jgi:hypothetical protein
MGFIHLNIKGTGGRLSRAPSGDSPNSWGRGRERKERRGRRTRAPNSDPFPQAEIYVHTLSTEEKEGKEYRREGREGV